MSNLYDSRDRDFEPEKCLKELSNTESVSRVQFASNMNFSTLFVSEMEHVILNSFNYFLDQNIDPANHINSTLFRSVSVLWTNLI